MAEAGSVAPVFRDEGYVASATYDFYHAIIHNNKLYFCRQDGTIGHEPKGVSDEYWFLSLDGNFADAEMLGGETAEQWQGKIDSILNGTTAVGKAKDANTVGGYHENQLAKTGASFPMTIYGFANDFGVDQSKVYNGTIDDLVNAMPVHSILHTIIYKPFFPNIGIPGGASEYLELYIIKLENLQVDIKLTDNLYKHEYHNMRYNSATCLGWHEKYLPIDGSVPVKARNELDGGRLLLEKPTNSLINGNLAIDVFTNTDGKTYARIFENGGDYRGVVIDLTECANGIGGLGSKLIHTGNSNAVIKATTAPSDTKAVWVDTANKKVKAYIDGAWTELA